MSDSDRLFTAEVLPDPFARAQLRLLVVLSAVLLVCFAKPLLALLNFALHSDLFSYVLLIPFISGYLVWIKRQSLPSLSKPVRGYSLVPFVGGLLALLFWLRGVAGTQNSLSLATLSLLLLFV